MLRQILRRKALFAFLGAFFMLVQPASAGHLTFSFAVATDTTHAYSDLTITIDFGTTEVVSMTNQLPDGWLVAHADSTTSHITPVPLDGHTVGTGTATANWEPFCTGTSSKSITAKWEATIDSGAPANTVAQINLTVDLLFTTKAYVVKNGTNDYDIVIPDMPDEYACDGSSSSMTLTIYGDYTSQGTTYRVLQNPLSAGTYTATATGTDANNTDHTASAGVTIS